LVSDQSVTLNQKDPIVDENAIMGMILVLVFLSLFLIPLGHLVAFDCPWHFGNCFVIFADFFDVTINGFVTFWNDYRIGDP